MPLLTIPRRQLETVDLFPRQRRRRWPRDGASCFRKGYAKGSRSSNGIPRVWSLRRRSRCGLDCSRRVECVRLSDDRSKDPSQFDYSFWSLNRIRACKSACFAKRTLCPSPNEPIHVDTRYRERESWQYASVHHQRPLQKYRRNAPSALSNILRARSARLTYKL